MLEGDEIISSDRSLDSVRWLGSGSVRYMINRIDTAVCSSSCAVEVYLTTIRYILSDAVIATVQRDWVLEDHPLRVSSDDIRVSSDTVVATV